MIISGISFILNLLAILLPNIKFRSLFRFRARRNPSDVINYNINQNQISKIDNNIEDKNMSIPENYPSFAENGQINSVPVVDSQYNEDIKNKDRNESINSMETINKSVFVYNKDMGTAPLPADEIKVKINK